MNNDARSKRRSCPICSHSRSVDHHDSRHDGWELKVCAKCEFVYLANPPGYEALIEDFAWEKTYTEERRRRFSDEPILRRWRPISNFIRFKVFKRNKLASLLKRFSGPGRILDVGCGNGRKLNNMLAKSQEPWGIEISKVLAEKANEVLSLRGGRCIQNDGLSGLSSVQDGFFDAIMMMSYLEHEINPRAVCEAANRCLRVGGHLIVKVPNHSSWNRRVRKKKWCGYRFPDHVNYFTPTSLTELLRDSGFNIVKFNWLDRLPTSDNMWVVAQRRHLA
jgi:SAM-dependent methyltransferase